MPNIHQRIAEMTDLAKIYAEDGAFHTAANRLRQLADEIDAHITSLTTPTINSLNAKGVFVPDPRDTPAPGKVMEAPSGSFVPPLAHLTDEQQRIIRKADANRRK